MDMSWIRISVRGLIGVCMIVSVVECAVDGSEHSEGLRLICGAAVAAFVARLAVEAMGVFL